MFKYRNQWTSSLNIQIDLLSWHLQIMVSKMNQFISSRWLKKLGIYYEYTLTGSIIIKLLEKNRKYTWFYFLWWALIVIKLTKIRCFTYSLSMAIQNEDLLYLHVHLEKMPIRSMDIGWILCDLTSKVDWRCRQPRNITKHFYFDTKTDSALGRLSQPTITTCSLFNLIALIFKRILFLE